MISEYLQRFLQGIAVNNRQPALLANRIVEDIIAAFCHSQNNNSGRNCGVMNSLLRAAFQPCHALEQCLCAPNSLLSRETVALRFFLMDKSLLFRLGNPHIVEMPETSFAAICKRTARIESEREQPFQRCAIKLMLV